jgi:hypothetical protein
MPYLMLVCFILLWDVHTGDASVLNVYLVDLSINLDSLLGMATFPWQTDADCPGRRYRREDDGIWLHYNTIPGGGNKGGYDLGATLVHEVNYMHIQHVNATPSCVSANMLRGQCSLAGASNHPCKLRIDLYTTTLH